MRTESFAFALAGCRSSIVAVVAALVLGGCASSSGTQSQAVTDAAVDATSANDASTSPEVVACQATGASCADPILRCCTGVCSGTVWSGGALGGELVANGTCIQTCTSGAECDAGCCAAGYAEAVDAGTVCAPRGYCASTCVQQGSGCTTTTDCCPGQACVILDLDGGPYVCTPTCTGTIGSLGCDSGCMTVGWETISPADDSGHGGGMGGPCVCAPCSADAGQAE